MSTRPEDATAERRRHDLEVTSSRLLFERHDIFFKYAPSVLLGFVCVLTAISFLAKTSIGVIDIVAVVGIVIGFFVGLRILGSIDVLVLRCYERGVCRTILGRRSCYRYDELASLTFGPLKRERDEIKIGKVQVEFKDAFDFAIPYEIELEPVGARRSDNVMFGVDVRLGPEVVWSLRNTIAAAMAVPLLTRAGARLSWTGRVCFEGDRLVYDFQSTPERSVAVSEIEYLEFLDNTLLIYVAGRHEPLVELDMFARNFYPGLFCLEHLRGRSLPPLFAIQADGEFASIRPGA